MTPPPRLIDPFTLQNDLSLAEQSVANAYIAVASWAWLVWDWVSTLDNEVEYVWLSPWSMSKVIYIAARYFGLFLLSLETASAIQHWGSEFCYFYFFAVGLGTTISVCLVAVSMQFRVFALYDGSKKILLVNAALFLATAGLQATFFGIQMQKIQIYVFPKPIQGCRSDKPPTILEGAWWIALAYQFYLFSLVVNKAYARAGGKGWYRLVGAFYLTLPDALRWFICSTTLLAWNMSAFLNQTNGSLFLGLPIIHAASSLAGSHLAIDMRKAVAPKDTDETPTFLVVTPLPPPRASESTTKAPRRTEIGSLLFEREPIPHRWSSAWASRRMSIHSPSDPVYLELRPARSRSDTPGRT